jgi:hypothetical protein
LKSIRVPPQRRAATRFDADAVNRLRPAPTAAADLHGLRHRRRPDKIDPNKETQVMKKFPPRADIRDILERHAGASRRRAPAHPGRDPQRPAPASAWDRASVATLVKSRLHANPHHTPARHATALHEPARGADSPAAARLAGR